MTDRELLEAAAEAAGMNLGKAQDKRWFYCEHGQCGEGMYLIHENLLEFWNPLANDGDAFRLAVRLGIQIRQYPIYDTPRFAAYACESKWDSDAQKNIGPEALVQYDGDPYASTRRAIVRAAAALTRMESKE